MCVLKLPPRARSAQTGCALIWLAARGSFALTSVEAVGQSSRVLLLDLLLSSSAEGLEKTRSRKTPLFHCFCAVFGLRGAPPPRAGSSRRSGGADRGCFSARILSGLPADYLTASSLHLFSFFLLLKEEKSEAVWFSAQRAFSVSFSQTLDFPPCPSRMRAREHTASETALFWV